MGAFKKIGDGITTVNKFINDWASLLIYPLTFAVVYEVIRRYIFTNPTNWVYDMTWILYAIFTFLGGAYALHTGTHVKADIIYNMLPKKGQIVFDIISYLVFFFPVMGIMVYSCWGYMLKSFAAHDVSQMTSWAPALWPTKMILFISMLMVLLQGIVEFVKAISPLWQKGGDEQ